MDDHNNYATANFEIVNLSDIKEAVRVIEALAPTWSNAWVGQAVWDALLKANVLAVSPIGLGFGELCSDVRVRLDRNLDPDVIVPADQHWSPLPKPRGRNRDGSGGPER